MKKILIYIITACFCILIIPMVIVSLGTSAYFNDGDTAKRTKDPSKTPWKTHDAGTPAAGISGTPIPLNTDKSGDYIIDVYNTATGSIFQIDLEDYIAEVVLAEMPAVFELEAIKAQCVAARTYTYKRMTAENTDEKHKGAAVCTDSAHCQAWRALEDVVDSTPDRDGNGAMKAKDKITKVKKAAAETKGLIACYESEPIEALYHSCSGGMTEYADKVWDGKGYPYLIPVKSKGEEIAGAKYKTTVTVSKKEFINKMKANSTDFSAAVSDLYSSIKNIKRSSSDRILTLTISGAEFTGRDIRGMFDLNSTNITFKEKDDNIIMTTLGNGHGVGLSQYGAHARAKEGMDFEEILKYYYTGIEIERI